MDSFTQTTAAFVQRYWHDAGQQPEAWLAALRAAGWTAPHWPKARGGCGWSEREYFEWQQLCVRAGAPLGDHLSLHGIGPLLAHHAEPEPGGQWLAAIHGWQSRWCLAVPDPLWPTAAPPKLEAATAGWILSGELAPLAGAVAADWALCLASGPQDPLLQTLVAVPLAQAGVERLPVPLLDEMVAGHSDGEPLLARLLFTQVPISSSQRVGAWGRGAELVDGLRSFAPALSPELTSSAALQGQLDDLAVLNAADPESDSAQLLQAELGVELAALQVLEQRLLVVAQPERQARALQLMRRQRACRLLARLADAQIAALGYYLLPYDSPRRSHNEPAIGPPIARSKVAALLRARGLLAAFDPLTQGHSELARALGLAGVQSSHNPIKKP